MSPFQQAKIWLVDTLHLERDALHIYVALLVFLGACLLFRWKASQWKPWFCVLAVALAGEAWDFADSFARSEPLAFGLGIKDIGNTLLIPTLLVLLARYSKVFAKRAGR